MRQSFIMDDKEIKIREADADYLDFINDWNVEQISFNERVQNPYFYYQFALDQLNKLNCLSVLDVGCGDGVFSKLCLKQNLEVAGVDKSEIARLEYKKNTGNCAYNDLNKINSNLKIIKEDFDAVAMLEILEHTDNPKELLEAGFKLTNKTLIFSVPMNDKIKSKFHKIIFNFYDVYNLASDVAGKGNFKIFTINKFQKFGNPLNLFGVVLFK